MIKIPISVIENVTGYKVKRNFVSIGSDTASKTGIAIIKVNGKAVTIECNLLSFDTSNHKIFFKNFASQMEKLIDKQDFCVVENIYLGKNPEVALFLARLNGFVILECIKKKVPYDTIGASSARSKLKIDARKFGAGKSKEAVAYWLKENLGIDLGLELNDCSDAICLALLGILDGLDFRSQVAIKEEKRKEKSKNGK